ncbi:hypothetical protein D2V07_03150 [Aurantiacibacter zhengii]|uniref:Photosynthetic complex assembly protein n=1 Tax=Aurantiacibacter zhengii TaxID=2307003 RepID=A0A418NXD3_9SPHN|nr:hypothetical protein D2V07_03150 [Aurantiacibacter zhengii]
MPRGALIGAALLVGFTVTTIPLARHYEVGRLETAALVDAPESRMLVFTPLPGGEMLVSDEQGHQLTRLVVEGDTFAMTAVRALAMQQPLRDEASEYHLLVQRDAGGHLELADPETGRAVKLEGFGRASVDAFAGYLDRSHG